jgi:membrane protease YdiL (CAAX protease family)
LPLQTLDTPFPDKNRAAIVGVILILSLLFLYLLLGQKLFGLAEVDASAMFVSRMYYWACLVFIWLYSLKVEKQNLLLWKEHKHPFLLYVVHIALLIIVLVVAMLILQIFLQKIGFNTRSKLLSALINIFRVNRPLILFTAATAGIVEELIFRGYLLPRLTNMFKSPVFACVISSVLFGLMHASYGTVANVAGPFIISLVLSVHYSKFRNIKALIITHFLWDYVLILLSLQRPQ